jgi:cytidylate kinase
MYRAVGWNALRRGLSLDDEAAVSAMTAAADIDVDGARVTIDGEDVTQAIRTPEIDKAATAVARMPQVRHILVARQRAMGSCGGVVIEGRDIGTVVFPTADVKIYLDASPDERARRRAADPAHGGRPQELSAVATALEARDRIDTTRTASPLTIAPDAVVVDTTGVAIPDVVARVLAIVRDRATRAHGNV